ADARTTQESLDETFYLTNISPQVGNGFNRDSYLPYEENGNWYVKYQLIGNPPNIAVPTHFFKVILASKENDSDSQGRKKYALGSFLIPNQRIPHDDPLEKYVVPLDALERATGLRFFENLNKNDTQPLCEATKCVLIPHPKWVE
ncbi:8202_t:CDS:2, partial [Scutellospora calospora]